jgi:putative integral membrane protein (TIGR02587 family)
MTATLAPSLAAPERTYVRDLARAFGGALLFILPLLMTMEMWAFGFSMDRIRLLVFIAASLPLLFGLAYYAGFSARRGLANDLLDTSAALAVGFLTAAGLLLLLGVITPQTTLPDSIGQVMIQAVPGAIGALLARRQLSGGAGDTDAGANGDEGEASYPGELFLMAVGALFLALNLAPTEEMILIGYKATPWHALAILIVSLTMLHVVVFTAGFAGQEEHDRPGEAFLHFTLPGYAIALGVSLFTLWAFGRTDGEDLAGVVNTTVVLGLPASVGAAAARLLV